MGGEKETNGVFAWLVGLGDPYDLGLVTGYILLYIFRVPCKRYDTRFLGMCELNVYIIRWRVRTIPVGKFITGGHGLT